MLTVFCPSTDGEMLLDVGGSLAKLVGWKVLRVVLDRPYCLARRRVIGESWDDMPVNVRELVAQQFVVDLDGVEHDDQRARDFRHLFDELNAFFPCQIEQLGRVPLEHQHGPSGEKLIVVEVRDRESQLGDLVILGRPLPCADLTTHGVIISPTTDEVSVPLTFGEHTASRILGAWAGSVVESGRSVVRIRKD